MLCENLVRRAVPNGRAVKLLELPYTGKEEQVKNRGRTVKLLISEAAKQVGKSRNVLYRAIESGKLSVEKNSAGQQVIDTSELLRVYGDALRTPEQAIEKQVKKPTLVQKEHTDISISLLMELGELRGASRTSAELIAMLKEQLLAADKRAELAAERALLAEARAIEAMTMNQRLLVDLQAVAQPKQEDGKKGKRKSSVIK